MKILFYLLTVICGLVGILGLLRTFEVLALGGGLRPVQILIAVAALILGWVFLTKARAK